VRSYGRAALDVSGYRCSSSHSSLSRSWYSSSSAHSTLPSWCADQKPLRESGIVDPNGGVCGLERLEPGNLIFIRDRHHATVSVCIRDDYTRLESPESARKDSRLL
jgi:hypothetical protein